MDMLNKYKWSVSTEQMCLLLTLVYYPLLDVKFQAGEKLSSGIFPDGDVKVVLPKGWEERLTKAPKKEIVEKWFKLDQTDTGFGYFGDILRELDKQDTIKRFLPKIDAMVPFVVGKTYQEYLGTPDFLRDAIQRASDEVMETGASTMLGVYNIIYGAGKGPAGILRGELEKKFPGKEIRGVRFGSGQIQPDDNSEFVTPAANDDPKRMKLIFTDQ